jgi:hypothetical protein
MVLKEEIKEENSPNEDISLTKKLNEIELN